MKKITTSVIRDLYQKKEKITMLTAYDCPTAKTLDEAGVEIILVGDSLGMVVLGYDDTTKVSMEDMIHHSRAVGRGAKNSMIITDMPFLSYHMGINESVKNAGRLVQEGYAAGVKLEGGKEIAETVKAIVNAGIPVVGHLGLTPQSVNTLGGYFVQGKSKDEAQRIISDAKSLQEAGVFAIVFECIPSELSEMIIKEINVPAIGIGAGNICDGQVLVINDMAGINMGRIPSFVKKYGNAGEEIKKAVEEYIKEVKNIQYPNEKYSFFSEKLR